MTASGARFTTITGDDWKRNMLPARVRRASSTERLINNMKTKQPQKITVKLPARAVQLGSGGTFRVPAGGFDGWAIIPGEEDTWQSGRWDGVLRACEYAAPYDSAVARLNGLFV